MRDNVTKNALTFITEIILNAKVCINKLFFIYSHPRRIFHIHLHPIIPLFSLHINKKLVSSCFVHSNSPTQPAFNGLLFTFVGSLFKASFTVSIFPVRGATKSAVVFALSNFPFKNFCCFQKIQWFCLFQFRHLPLVSQYEQFPLNEFEHNL